MGTYSSSSFWILRMLSAWFASWYLVTERSGLATLSHLSTRVHACSEVARWGGRLSETAYGSPSVPGMGVSVFPWPMKIEGAWRGTLRECEWQSRDTGSRAVGASYRPQPY